MAKRPKKAADWIDELDDALCYREQFGREAAWKKIEQDYLNDPEGDTAVGPNLVHSMSDSLMSSLQFPDPEFIATPERQDGVDKAPIVESLDNYLLRKLRLKKYVNASLLNGFLYPCAILKFGYDSEFSWSPKFDIGAGNNLLGMSFTQFNKKTGARIESPDIQPGWPWVRPVLPHDFIVPWGTIFLEDAPWVAHRIIRHVDHIKVDPKYQNTSRLEGEISLEDFMKSYTAVGASKQHETSLSKGISMEARRPEFIELFEIRDRMTGKILVVTRQSEDYLRNENDAIQLACGLPFVAATLVQSPRSFWVTPPAYYLGQFQKTEFDIALQSDKQRRISILKFLFRSKAITESALNRMLSGEVGAAAGIDTTYPLNEIVQPLNTGSTFDFVAHSENNRRNAREAIGFSRNQLGEYDSSSRRTAREATFVAAGSQRRVDRQTGIVVDLYTDAINKLNGLIFEFWRVPREVLYNKGWIQTTGPSLKGDYLYDVSLTFKRQISRSERKLEAMSLLPAFLPLLAQMKGADIPAFLDMIVNAAGDSSFEKVLLPLIGQARQSGSAGGGQPPSAAAGALPTIPATQSAPR